MAEENPAFPKNGSKIFLRGGLDSRIRVESPREIRFFAQADFWLEDWAKSRHVELALGHLVTSVASP
jgi:hypothetical protein